MEREKPFIDVMGTVFIIDVDKTELRQKDNPANVISIFDMKDTGTGYQFEYLPKTKNMPLFFNDKEGVTFLLPELLTLDPAGMAEKYNCPLDQIHLMTDFDLMVDQVAYQKRLSGILPVIEIADHPFYVDIRMGMLRPHDDFLSKGIVFSEIENYFMDDQNAYSIPYNPKTHEFQEIDIDTILEFPKDLISVSFPNESILDPIGYNRSHGLDERSNLKETNIKSRFKAEYIAWKDTGLEEIIKENNKRSVKKESTNSNKPPIKKRPKL
ncbi:hypothetical protein CLU96_2320 [Chryseobacterium sp. 52]|uniref:hypothetical protein n=1 Tax=Chryseobacterium sp. 52 TaxID=2035213 RepID=UPI000C18AE59|nr:hypothetical protein [Chryseobacterium sp. 52]PIF45318.1 hypothetical protein CLU96_2320 [Chryseobacterium sp. 52]